MTYPQNIRDDWQYAHLRRPSLPFDVGRGCAGAQCVEYAQPGKRYCEGCEPAARRRGKRIEAGPFAAHEVVPGPYGREDVIVGSVPGPFDR